VPKLPSARLADLVGTMAPGLRMVETGIRPGEKLHEVMVPSDESRLTLELRDHYVLEPAFPWWSERPRKMPGARRVAEGFEYRSDNNPELLSGARLRQFLRQAHVD
jgi:UDP-N-acetylglucosamine 4,6-dehydratase